MTDLHPDKRCHGGNGCTHCGMDMDLEPYCVNESVLALRTAETGRDYPFGLDTNPARAMCKGKYFEARSLLRESEQQNAKS